MDIKERIDALSEQEAKAALCHLVNLVGTMARCRVCIINTECLSSSDDKSCKERLLDWATADFEEARK